VGSRRQICKNWGKSIPNASVSTPPNEAADVVVIADADMAGHLEVVEAHHRFSGVEFKGKAWDLSHLDAFALRIDPGLGFAIDVVVLFSCHCFTRSHKQDGRPLHAVPDDERFDNGRESRVLCNSRYELSRRFLPWLIKELPHRTIQFAGTDPLNFITLEELDSSGEVERHYAVFFEVRRDNRRRKRLLLHVQSAYELTELTIRQSKAKKVKFPTLLRAAYEGRKLRG